jgi:hypothetical protein
LEIGETVVLASLDVVDLVGRLGAPGVVTHGLDAAMTVAFKYLLA